MHLHSRQMLIISSPYIHLIDPLCFKILPNLGCSVTVHGFNIASGYVLSAQVALFVVFNMFEIGICAHAGPSRMVGWFKTVETPSNYRITAFQSPFSPFSFTATSRVLCTS